MFRRENVKAWSAAASTLKFADSSFKLNTCDRDLTYRWAERIPTSLFWRTQMSHPVNTGRRSNRQSDTVLMEQIWCDQYRANQSAIALMFWQTNTNRYHHHQWVWDDWRLLQCVFARCHTVGLDLCMNWAAFMLCGFVISQYIYNSFLCACVCSLLIIPVCVRLHSWDWSKCPCVITSLCVCVWPWLPAISLSAFPQVSCCHLKRSHLFDTEFLWL